MLEISEVANKVADISDVSFCDHEVEQAMAIRMPERGSKEAAAIEVANEKLVLRSGGTLAPVLRAIAEIQVMGCTHNTAGLAAVNAGAKCDIPRISERGCYSVAKIVSRCPSYEQPLRVGLKYFVMEYCVEARWPLFVELVCEACNIGSQLAKPDTLMQIMGKVHARVQQAEANGTKANYDDIKKKVERTKPALESDELGAVCQYIEKWCGGVANPRFLHKLQSFADTLQNPCYIELSKKHC